MLVNKGGKIVLKEKMGLFTNVGEVCDVVDVANGIISFKFGDGMHLGCMSEDEADKYFTKYVEEPKILSVNPDDIDDIIENCEFEVCTAFDKCTIVACRLPNGFVIVEYSACVDPNNYDEEIGFNNCFEKIVDKIWELEGYKLQADNFNEEHLEDDDIECYGDCDHCQYCEEDNDEECDDDWVN